MTIQDNKSTATFMEKKTSKTEGTKVLNITIVSNSEVFEHYGKPFTSGRDLWDFITAHYNFTPKI